MIRQSSSVTFSSSRASFHSTCVYAPTACLSWASGSSGNNVQDFRCRHVWRWSTLLGTYGVMLGVVADSISSSHDASSVFLKLLVSLRMFETTEIGEIPEMKMFPAFFASWITAALFLFFRFIPSWKFFATFPIIFLHCRSLHQELSSLAGWELAWEQSCNESWKQSRCLRYDLGVYCFFLEHEVFVPQSLLQCDYKLNSFARCSPTRPKSSFFGFDTFLRRKRVQNITDSLLVSNVLLALCTRSSNSWSLGT